MGIDRKISYNLLSKTARCLSSPSCLPQYSKNRDIDLDIKALYYKRGASGILTSVDVWNCTLDDDIHMVVKSYAHSITSISGMRFDDKLYIDGDDYGCKLYGHGDNGYLRGVYNIKTRSLIGDFYMQGCYNPGIIANITNHHFGGTGYTYSFLLRGCRR